MTTRRARGLLVICAAAYATGFAAMSALRYRAFQTGRFDLGNMVQSVWTTAHGHFLQMTDLQGHEISRLGAHFDPILAAFAPFWWIWPNPNLLLTTQAIAIALGAVPVFRLARKHLGSERAALGFSLAYLLYPPTEWLTLDEFHPVALACPLLLFAFWYLDEDRLLPFALFAGAAALTKEQIPLVIAGMGAWYALSRRRWVEGGAICVAGIAASLLIVEVVIPHFSRHGKFHFYGRYRELGDSPGTIVSSLAHHPVRAVRHAFDLRGIRYLLQLVLPLAGLCLLAPLALIPALPEVALNLLSSTRTQTSIHFHYTAGLIPPLIVAAIFGSKRLLGLRHELAVSLAGLVLASTLVGNYILGALPIWSRLPGGETLDAHDFSVSRRDRISSEAVSRIPKTAAVTATNGLGSHLSARHTILSFPELRGANWVAVDEAQMTILSQGVKPLRGTRQLVRLRRNPSWHVVFQRDGIVLFHRRE